ncbi:MAG TPA: hypothetical protein VIO95_11630, partial [Mycobacterium sp.]
MAEAEMGRAAPDRVVQDPGGRADLAEAEMGPVDRDLVGPGALADTRDRVALADKGPGDRGPADKVGLAVPELVDLVDLAALTGIKGLADLADPAGR